MIRMIVTDLDGTLLAGKNNIPEENIRALRRAMDAGVLVVLASGRMIEATLPIAQRIGVNAPMSLFNGGMVYDGETDRILDGETIDCDLARAVLKEIEAVGGYAHAFPGRGFYYSERCEWTDYYEDKIGIKGVRVGDSLSNWISVPVYKLLCLASAEELERLRDHLEPRFEQLSFVKSAPCHLEVVARGVDKAKGLKQLGACTGVRPEEMLAFGDEMNDLPMLKYAGTAYAMENAVEGVRREISRIAPANTEAGVAKIVNLYLDEGRMGRG